MRLFHHTSSEPQPGCSVLAFAFPSFSYSSLPTCSNKLTPHRRHVLDLRPRRARPPLPLPAPNPLTSSNARSAPVCNHVRDRPTHTTPSDHCHCAIVLLPRLPLPPRTRNASPWQTPRVAALGVRRSGSAECAVAVYVLAARAGE